MKYLALMFGMWMTALVVQKYLHEQQVGVCAQPPTPQHTTIYSYPVSMTQVNRTTPVVYRF